jgi:hypothetical protein
MIYNSDHADGLVDVRVRCDAAEISAQGNQAGYKEQVETTSEFFAGFRRKQSELIKTS